MTRVFSIALGLAFWAAPALAQAPSEPTSPPSSDRQILAQRGMNESQSWRGGRNWRDQRDQRDDEDDRDSARAQPDGRDSRDGRQARQGRGASGGESQAGRDSQDRMSSLHAGMGMTMGGNSGVRIRLRRGDTAIDVRCPGSSSDLNACIGAAGQLLDRLGGAGASSSAPSGSPGSPSSPQAR